MNNDFLNANEFLIERVNMGIDIHPSEAELKTFQDLAKAIDAQRHFTIYGCQECNKSLVKFVYENYTDEEVKTTKKSK